MAELLGRRFGERIQFTLPAGGLAVWVKFTNAVNMDELIRAAHHQGVKILPGSTFAIADRAIAATRLGFASMNANELDAATFRLRQALGTVTRID
jgi:GntR family transcriptional regulator / MocR family aminotransferase